MTPGAVLEYTDPGHLRRYRVVRVGDRYLAARRVPGGQHVMIARASVARWYRVVEGVA